MSEYVNIRSGKSRSSGIPTKEVEIPSPSIINEDLKAAVVQMDSIETSKYKLKEKEPRSPAPLPEAVSPAGVPIDMDNDEREDVELNSSKSDFKIDLGSYEVMDQAIDVSMEGNKPSEYKRNGKGSVIIIALVLIALHLISSHCTMFTYVIDYESPDLILATVLYFISSLCILFLMLAMLIVPGLSVNEDKFNSYYGTVLIAGGLDFVAVMIGGSAFSPLGFYTKDMYRYMTFYWEGLIECLVINGILFYAFTRKSGDGKLFGFFHPFMKPEPTETPENIESDDSKSVASQTEV